MKNYVLIKLIAVLLIGCCLSCDNISIDFKKHHRLTTDDIMVIYTHGYMLGAKRMQDGQYCDSITAKDSMKIVNLFHE